MLRFALAASCLMVISFDGDLTQAQEGAPSVDDFLRGVQESDTFSKKQASRVLEIAAGLAADGASQAEIVHAGLFELHGDFQKAMLLMGDEETASARILLAELAKSPDGYLAAESVYFLARTCVNEEQFEQAVPVFESLSEKHAEFSLRKMETLFYLGICQAKLLDRQQASRTLRRFLAEYPDAAERMRVAATEELWRLEGIDDGTLADIQGRMEYVRRRLTTRQSGRRTQDEQERIIAMLDELLKPRDGGDGPSPKDPPKGPPRGDDPPHDHPHPGPHVPGGPGGNNGDSPADDGAGAQDGNPNQPPVRPLRTRKRNGSNWDQVNDKAREEKAFAALKAKFPARYAQLIKQYYRSCMEEAER